jgi:hypothetical protein
LPRRCEVLIILLDKLKLHTKECMDPYYLHCTVAVGQFTGEFAVGGQLFDGTSFSLFAPASDLQVAALPADNASVEGAIKVELLQCQGELSLVRLPQPTLENGRTVTVTRDQLIPATPASRATKP